MAKASPDLELHFPGEEIRPELISIRLLADAVSAIARFGADGYLDEADVASMSLLAVKRGSATFQCAARNAQHLIEKLDRAGRLLSKKDISDELGLLIQPIRRLSEIASSVGCPIVIRRPHDKHILAEIKPETYEMVSSSLLVRGHKTMPGNVQRVGGATERRCALRVAFQDHLLYCTVSTVELARALGKSLYQDVVVSGEATQLRKSWAIVDFRIDEVMQRDSTPLRDAFEALRDAGGDAWDKVKDPHRYLEELTGH